VISLDANILVYGVDSEAGTRHVRAQDIIRRASNANGALTEQAMFEFFHAATRKGRTTWDHAAAAIHDLLQSFTLLLPHRTIVEDVLDLQSRYLLGIWDARLLAVCAAHGCTHLLSEDLQDGARYDGVTAINPFDPANAAVIGSLL